MLSGNLDNEYKENGMSFVNLEESGDEPLNVLCVVMNGKYIYAIGGEYRYEMDVHRFDVSTRKWELLHKSMGQGPDSEPIYQCEALFYKGKICILGGGLGGTTDHFYGFSVSVK